VLSIAAARVFQSSPVIGAINPVNRSEFDRNRESVRGLSPIHSGSRRRAGALCHSPKCRRRKPKRHPHFGRSRQRGTSIEHRTLARALDRLTTLTSGNEPKISVLFAQAELNCSYCGQRSSLLASTPKHKTLCGKKVLR
jgi:hypothetical protein